VYNLKADRYIGGHSKIASPEVVTYLLASAIRAAAPAQTDADATVAVAVP